MCFVQGWLPSPAPPQNSKQTTNQKTTKPPNQQRLPAASGFGPGRLLFLGRFDLPFAEPSAGAPPAVRRRGRRRRAIPGRRPTRRGIEPSEMGSEPRPEANRGLLARARGSFVGCFGAGDETSLSRKLDNERPFEGTWCHACFWAFFPVKGFG